MTREVDLASLAGELAGEAETVALEEPGAERYAVRGARPRLLCAPATSEAMGAALARCDRAGAAVVPWGGGTHRRLGLPPRGADVVLSTARLNRLVEYEPGDLTATVEAGMPFADLQALLAGNGQGLPLDPPLLPGATVGGVVATNGSGPRRLRDGGPRDLVIGTRTANVDGTVTRAGGRVVKNVTGYDLNKAHVGALGTLGILAEVTFKISPRPETELSWYGVFATAEAAGGAASALLRLPLTPTALDLLNDRAAGALGLAVPTGRWALLGRASGFRQAVERHLVEFEAAARSAGAVEGQRLSDEAAGPLWEGYQAMAASLRWAPGALTCRLALPPAAAPPLAGRLAARSQGAAIWGHGTGTLFFSLPEAEAGPVLVAALREMVEGAGGAMVVENWPESMAGIDVWGPPGGAANLLRAIKAQFDPRGTLNPGRFVAGI